MSTLADRLKDALEGTGIKQVDIARACGIRPPSVADWFNGKTQNIRGANLVITAKILGVSEAWLAAGVLPRERQQEADAWPFATVTKEEYSTLSVLERQIIENAVRGMLTANERHQIAGQSDVRKAMAKVAALSRQGEQHGNSSTTRNK